MERRISAQERLKRWGVAAGFALGTTPAITNAEMSEALGSNSDSSTTVASPPQREEGLYIPTEQEVVTLPTNVVLLAESGDSQVFSTAEAPPIVQDSIRRAVGVLSQFRGGDTNISTNRYNFILPGFRVEGRIDPTPVPTATTGPRGQMFEWLPVAIEDTLLGDVIFIPPYDPAPGDFLGFVSSIGEIQGNIVPEEDIGNIRFGFKFGDEATIHVGEELIATGFPNEAGRIVWERIETSAVNLLTRTEAMASLPQTTYSVENAVATQVPINQNIEIRNGELVVFSEDGRESLVYNERLRTWFMPQFTTENGLVELRIDEGFTRDLDLSSRYIGSEINQHFVFDAVLVGSVGQILRDPQSHFINLREHPDERQAYLDVYRVGLESSNPVENSILTSNPENGGETLENLTLTAFTMFYFRTGTPTDAQLLEIRDRHRAGEDLRAQTNSGEWRLREGMEILLSPHPVLGQGWYGNIIGTLPDQPFTVRDGKVVVHSTAWAMDSWGAYVDVSIALRIGIRDSGVAPPMWDPDGYGFPLYPKLVEVTYPFEDEVIVLPFLLGKTTSPLVNGQSLTYGLFN